MKAVVFLSLALLCYVSATSVKEDSALENEFKSIERELEKITKDEAKSDLEAQLFKLDVKKDETKKEVAMKEEVAQEIGQKDAGKKTPDDFKALHDIMKKFDTGSMNKGKLILSLEDYFKKDEKPSGDVSSSGKCKDVRNDCARISSYCKYKSHEKKMREKCAKTCSFCVECANSLDDAKCVELGKFGYCRNPKFSKPMKTYCFKECGYCKPSFIPECSKSKLGCCWDKETKKQDAVGSNCPACVDRYRYACNTFRMDCMKSNAAGEFMREHCSLTCGLCKKCYDEPDYAAKCPSWKKLGWCENMKTTMDALCKSTCNLC